jgi:hypothetical protein
MTTKHYAVLCLFGLDLVILVATVGACYAWLRATHTPLRVYERKMLCYSVLLLASCPILGPLWLSLAYWLMPLKPSVVVAVTLFLIWGVVAFPLVQRHYKQEDRLSEKHL